MNAVVRKGDRGALDVWCGGWKTTFDRAKKPSVVRDAEPPQDADTVGDELRFGENDDGFFVRNRAWMVVFRRGSAEPSVIDMRPRSRKRDEVLHRIHHVTDDRGRRW